MRARGGMLPRPWAWLMALSMALTLALALALATGCSSEPGQAPAEQALVSPALEQARKLAPELEARRRRGLAWCALAGKASQAAPELAVKFSAQAWDEVRGLYLSPAGQLAGQLRAGEGGAPSPEDLALAARLSDLAGRAWPCRVVAEASLTLAPPLAEQALRQGVDLAKAETDPQARDQDLAGLAQVLARQDPRAARALAGELSDSLWRSWLWRELAVQEGTPQAAQRAVAAARQVAAPGARALELARAALLGFENDPAEGLNQFQEAFEAAGAVADPRQRAWCQGRVAELLVRVDPESGWALARRVEPLEGARFPAFRKAGLALLGGDPLAGGRALDEAWQAALTLPPGAQRQKGLALLAADLAAPDPAQAQRILAGLPPGENLLRGEAQAAMVLAQAARDPQGALAQVQRLPEAAARALLLARLGDIAARDDPEKAKALYGQALDLAQGQGADAARQALAPGWAALEPRKGVDIALGIGENVARAKALAAVAKVLARQGQDDASRWALHLAQETISALDPQLALDKARLLGDMGQDWADLNLELARRFFEMAAAAIRTMN